MVAWAAIMHPRLAIVAVGLVASLAANVYFLARPSVAASAGAVPGAAVETTQAGAAPAESRCAADLGTCRRQLAVFSAAAASPLAAETGVPSGRSGAGAAPGALPPPPPPEDVLCTVAQAKLREQWLAKKGAVLSFIKSSVTNEAQRKADDERDAKRIADSLGTKGDPRRRGFEEEFMRMRQQRFERTLAARKANPPDWNLLLADTQSLYDAEDQLVAKSFGDEAAGRVKADAMNQRVQILSLLATYADVPWDVAIAAAP